MYKYKIHKAFGDPIRGLQPIVCGPPYMPSRSNHTPNWEDVTCESCLRRRKAIEGQRERRLAKVRIRKSQSQRARYFEKAQILAEKREMEILDLQNDFYDNVVDNGSEV